MTLRLTATLLARANDGDGGSPTLIVGPSLGTSVRALWAKTADELAGDVTVIGWDLPGHGESPDADVDFTVADLAEAVVRLLDALRASGEVGAGPVFAAGDSLGGAVTLQLGIDHPGRFAGLVAVCTAAKLGSQEGWLERAGTVAAAGTPTMIVGSAQRWFAPGFIERAPEVTTRLLRSLQDADRFGYARCCRALARYDVRAELGRITDPLLVIAGALDEVCPPAEAASIADQVSGSAVVVLADVAHLAPAEAPAETARALRSFMAENSGRAVRARVVEDPYAAGLAVRRAVLGDAHVDRATAGASDFTREFQELITRYAWGSIWTRPGLDRVTRSAITLTALIAGDHWDELRLHTRAALRNGMTTDQLKEVLLQSAIYCSVPSANTAFKIVQEELRAD